MKYDGKTHSPHSSAGVLESIAAAAARHSVDLVLRESGFTKFPDKIYELKQLRILDLSYCRLTRLDLDLSQFPELEVLNLSDNRLKALPPTLAKLTQLKYLYLDHNLFTTLPAGIGRLSSLEELYASNNRLTKLPSSIGAMLELRTLFLGNNALSDLPPTIGKLRRLQRLNIAGNKFESLPSCVRNLPELSELDISHNRLANWEEESCALPRLVELDISDNRLVELPSRLGRMPNLQTLRLRANQLVEIADSCVNLPRLTLLDVSNNSIRSLARITSFRNLAILDLSGNQITEIPEAIVQTHQLRQLHMTGNRLTALPRTIGDLTELESLDVGSNRLTTIPAAIGKLSKLSRLELSDNALKELPDSLKRLRSLKRLELSGNRALGLPLEVLAGAPQERPEVPLTIVKELAHHGLPETETTRNYRLLLKSAFDLQLLTSQRHADLSGSSFLSPDPAEILEYYFRIRDALRPLNEAKLILLGRGGVGKTSLVRRLVHGRFELGEPRTEGIAITEWALNLSEAETARLNIWDFGGQEIMHATHQFFLTQRAIYLVVLNGREGGVDADADHWLKLIESFGAESPAIVVLNKMKLTPFSINRHFLQDKYPFIRNFIETDCSDGFGIESLHEGIRATTDDLPHLRDSFPASWFAIKDELSSSTQSYLTFQQYRDVCARLGETNVNAQESLASYLHSLGIALNYKNDPRLQDTHILNPHWVTNGIYTLLNSQVLRVQKGEIRLSQLAEILNNESYPPVMHRFLMDLMCKFEICFTFPDDAMHYLIPELLDNQEPIDLMSLLRHPRLEFQYHYPILPEGLLPRFIVRTHAMSRNSQRWRTGVVLRFEDSVAVVRADIQDKKVFIVVSGSSEYQRPFLAVIRAHLNDIHSLIPNLNSREMIPLPQFPGTLVDYAEFRVLERDGIRTFPKVIGSAVVQINVGELLGGVDVSLVTHMSGVIRPEEPFSNVVRLRAIIRSSEEYLYWADLHFSARALEEIAAAVELTTVRQIKILSGPANVNERARKDFARFCKELGDKGVSAEWRVLEDFAHDRFIITKKACYNVPPINSLLKGSYSEILPTANRPPFQSWWNAATSIV